jgi:hypothetical protein
VETATLSIGGSKMGENNLLIKLDTIPVIVSVIVKNVGREKSIVKGLSARGIKMKKKKKCKKKKGGKK